MRLLLTGASGQLGAYLLRELRASGLRVTAWSGTRQGELFNTPLRPVDLTNPDAVRAAFHDARPDVVLHAAALARVGDCHRDPDHAFHINATAASTLAELADAAGARLVHVSTDLVFDGEQAPYRETNPPAPLSVYGRTKAAGELAALGARRATVVRLSLLFGPSLAGRPSFFDEQITALRQRRSITLFADEWRTPLDLATAARALLALARSDYTGVLHVGGPERLSRLEMGQRLAHLLGADPSVIRTAQRDQAPAAEPRPRDVSLDSSRWRTRFPDQSWLAWQEALAGLAAEIGH